MFELKASGFGWQLYHPNSAGFLKFENQVKNQNSAVVAEGRGRQIYYCLGNQSAADQAKSAFMKFPNSHFLVYH